MANARQTLATVLAAAAAGLGASACGGDATTSAAPDSAAATAPGAGGATAPAASATGTAATAPAPPADATSPTGSTTAPAPAGTAPAAPTQTRATPTAAAPPARGPRGDGADVAAVTLTVQGYAAAFAAADGPGGCALLTPATRRQFVEQVRDDLGDVTCEQAFAQLAEASPQDERRRFAQAQVVDVSVQGDAATATIRVGGRSNSIPLQRTEGRWKIASAPGQ